MVHAHLKIRWVINKALVVGSEPLDYLWPKSLQILIKIVEVRVL